jgi:hypothetical protein
VAEQQHDESIEVFRETVRTFAQDFVAPHAAGIDRLNAYPEGFHFWCQAGEWGLHGELARLLDDIIVAACTPSRRRQCQQVTSQQ